MVALAGVPLAADGAGMTLLAEYGWQAWFLVFAKQRMPRRRRRSTARLSKMGTERMTRMERRMTEVRTSDSCSTLQMVGLQVKARDEAPAAPTELLHRSSEPLHKARMT